jgi:hypothetical protein
LQLGTMIYDPTDPMDKMFFNILATFAEFKVDLLRCVAERHGDRPGPRQAQGPGAEGVRAPPYAPGEGARRR